METIHRTQQRHKSSSLDSPATTTATPVGGDLADCDQREKPADAAERHGRNYAWSELMKRVFAAEAQVRAVKRNQSLNAAEQMQEILRLERDRQRRIEQYENR